MAYALNDCIHGACTSKTEQALYDWMPGYKFGSGLYNSFNGGDFTGWEALDGISLGVGLAGKGLNLAFSGGSNSVFWSGFNQGANTAAMQFGTTLEQTLGGRMLSWANYKVGIPVPSAVWRWASATFARNATGSATAVIRAEGQIWTQIEKPILMQRQIPINYIGP